ANQYYQEFAQMMLDLNKGATAYNFVVAGLSKGLNAEVKSLKVYPNPSNGRFNLSLTNAKIGTVKLTLTDITGKTVFESTQKMNGAEEMRIETNNLPKGIYNLLVTGPETVGVSRVVIY
ncbi:MAG TPA: T9SS type A sorting domain-containing protein, partial [Adhaeribacter sp.]|nr:T9SS type A sorting domain-containing protein [Adhaeribacter sp.]